MPADFTRSAELCWSHLVRAALVFVICALAAGPARAQGDVESAKGAYAALHAFALDGDRSTVSGLRLIRDRAEMTFTGTFYFSKPVLGRVTGAVFIGRGTFLAAPPDSVFEKENLQRILGSTAVESDFETAVLRFTDDSAGELGSPEDANAIVAPRALTLAAGFETGFLRETGANVASRLLLALREGERPGLFVAQFGGGRLGRFTFLMDYQCRIPATNFGINAGEEGLVFFYERRLLANTVWLAFRSLEDYRQGTATSADAFDLVRATAYRMNVDVRDPRKAMDVSGQIDLVARARVNTIPFALSESLPEFDKLRLEKAMRVKAARVGGVGVEFVQEEWEGGFTLLPPTALSEGEAFTVEFETSGDYIRDQTACECFVPLNNTEWYPRHGSTGRATYETTFLHRDRHKVASGGLRIKDGVRSEDKDTAETVYRVDVPVSFVTFAVGAYKVRTGHANVGSLGDVPLEFFSIPNRRIDEDFVLGEMARTVSYFSELFGAYPYPVFRAAFHPFLFGQGFASLLMVPNVSGANRGTDLLIAHEAAHEWWGNVVAWRSYRDQWLSEGFAQYSSLLYARTREKASETRARVEALRSTLREGPRIVRGGGGTGMRTGIGAGKVTDIGPLVLGQRLNTVESANAYQRLIYNKGALVLRMLHFLLTEPATGVDRPFFEMMTDFAARHLDDSATTESFAQVASEHFSRSPLAKQFGLTNLDWFFEQWVSETSLPSYRLEYGLEAQPDGQVVVRGMILQENTPERWLMPLPLVFRFEDGTSTRATLLARGPRQPLTIALPRRPVSVELDPDMWVLSEKTSTRKP